MKHEMTAREFIKARERMCEHVRAACGVCPFCSECGNDLSERGIEIVEKWAAEHPEPKPTIFVPDEIVSVATIEVTYVDPTGLLLSKRGIDERRKLFEKHIAPSLPNADDIKCVRVQQFVTKGHEEEV